MSLPVATLLAVSLFASGPLDLYAPTGTAVAVQSPADPALPEGCYGVATADRTGLLDEEPSVWTCEVPADGTDVLAAIDLVGGSWRPVLLRWWDGVEWVRFAPEPQPEALTRVVRHVRTDDSASPVATPVRVWTGLASSLIPADGDGARMDARCIASSTSPLYTYQYTPWQEIVNPSLPAPPQGPNIYRPTGRNAAGTSPPAGNPFAGTLVWWSNATWNEQEDLMVRGLAGRVLNWVCEITVVRTRGAP